MASLDKAGEIEMALLIHWVLRLILKERRNLGIKKSIGGKTNEDQYEKNRDRVDEMEGKNSSSTKKSSGGSSSASTEPKKSSVGSSSSTEAKKTSESKETNEATKKSKETYRDKLVKQYREGGLTKEEAEAAADKKIKTMKGVAIAAGVTALTIGGAVAYQKLGAEYFGKTIKEGTVLHTLSAEKDRTATGKAFYAAINKRDRDIYRGTEGFGLDRATDSSTKATKGKYDIQNIAKSNIKVASRSHGREALMEMINDKNGMSKDLKADLHRGVLQTASRPRYKMGKNEDTYRKLLRRELNGGDYSNLSKQESKLLYDIYNRTLIDNNNASKAKFYENLSKKGFGGVLDINDYKYSGFNSKAPTILFDTKKVAQKSAERLTSDEIHKATDKVDRAKLARMFGPTAGVYGAAGAALGAVAASKKYDQKQIRKGASRMTDSERKASLEKQASKYVNRYSYASTADYNKAKENWVNSQLKKIEKEQKKA